MKMKRIMSLVVAILFFVNNISYALGPSITSGNLAEETRPGTKDAMYALGQKLFAAKVGPGAIDFMNLAFFQGYGFLHKPEIWAYLNEYQTKFVKANYDNPPADWKKNNLIMKQTDLIRALKIFRSNSRISSDKLEIIEGWFPVDEKAGELPIARIEPLGGGRYTLIIHTKFVQMWNHIRKNDVWFELNLTPKKRRTVSVAGGIFYRLAKHEMAELSKKDGIFKSLGHIAYNLDIPQDDEGLANEVSGNYAMVNDAIWMWFLGSYCFVKSTRYDNETLFRRLEWFFTGEQALLRGFHLEFPNLLKDSNKRLFATALACAINYNFFDRPSVDVPKTYFVKPEFIKQHDNRQRTRRAAVIRENFLYATGRGEDEKAAPTPAASGNLTYLYLLPLDPIESGLSLEKIDRWLEYLLVLSAHKDPAISADARKRYKNYWEYRNNASIYPMIGENKLRVVTNPEKIKYYLNFFAPEVKFSSFDGKDSKNVEELTAVSDKVFLLIEGTYAEVVKSYIPLLPAPAGGKDVTTSVRSEAEPPRRGQDTTSQDTSSQGTRSQVKDKGEAKEESGNLLFKTIDDLARFLETDKTFNYETKDKSNGTWHIYSVKVYTGRDKTHPELRGEDKKLAIKTIANDSSTEKQNILTHKTEIFVSRDVNTAKGFLSLLIQKGFHRHLMSRLLYNIQIDKGQAQSALTAGNYETTKAASRTKPGKSPEDLIGLIAFTNIEREIFSTPILLKLYKKYHKVLGFDPPAKEDASALQTIRRDLYDSENSLFARSLVTPLFDFSLPSSSTDPRSQWKKGENGEYLFELTEKGYLKIAVDYLNSLSVNVYDENLKEKVTVKFETVIVAKDDQALEGKGVRFGKNYYIPDTKERIYPVYVSDSLDKIEFLTTVYKSEGIILELRSKIQPKLARIEKQEGAPVSAAGDTSKSAQTGNLVQKQLGDLSPEKRQQVIAKAREIIDSGKPLQEIFDKLIINLSPEQEKVIKQAVKSILGKIEEAVNQKEPIVFYPFLLTKEEINSIGNLGKFVDVSVNNLLWQAQNRLTAPKVEEPAVAKKPAAPAADEGTTESAGKVTPKAAPRTRPGKSPEDLIRLIMFKKGEDKVLSAPKLLKWYKKNYKALGFEKPAEIRDSALKTIRRDLYDSENSLCARGLVAPHLDLSLPTAFINPMNQWKRGKDGEYLFYLTFQGYKEVAKMRAQGVVAPAPAAPADRDVTTSVRSEAEPPRRGQVTKSHVEVKGEAKEKAVRPMAKADIIKWFEATISSVKTTFGAAITNKEKEEVISTLTDKLDRIKEMFPESIGSKFQNNPEKIIEWVKEEDISGAAGFLKEYRDWSILLLQPLYPAPAAGGASKAVRSPQRPMEVPSVVEGTAVHSETVDRGQLTVDIKSSRPIEGLPRNELEGLVNAALKNREDELIKSRSFNSLKTDDGKDELMSVLSIKEDQYDWYYSFDESNRNKKAFLDWLAYLAGPVLREKRDVTPTETEIDKYAESVYDLLAETKADLDKKEVKNTVVAEKSPILSAISEYVIDIGLDIGPGSVEPTREEIASFYPIYEMFSRETVEIYLPSLMYSSLTDEVRREVANLNKRIRGRTGREDDAVSFRPYDSYNLDKFLKREKEGVRRIFVNDNSMTDLLNSLLSGDSSIFRGKRLITTSIPQTKDKKELSVYQAWLVKVALLSAMVEESNMLTVGAALKEELKGRLDADSNISEFVTNLAGTENEAVEAVAKRINYFLGKIVKLSQFIGEQIRILKAFWIAA